MAIVDAVLFYDELDLLELRLHELNKVVDWFVIIEANRTFSGRPKQMNFHQNRQKFAAFLPKIVYWKVLDMPAGDDPWVREKHQRNAIARALKFMGLQEDDQVLVSDVDEIPRAHAVSKAASLKQPALFELRSFYYYVNIRCVRWPWWRDLRMASVHDLLPEPQHLRDKPANEASFRIIPDAGWHFSYLGGVKCIQRKIAAFSHHREYDKPQFTNAKHLKKCLREFKDLFNRKIDWQRVPLDDTYPQYLLANLSRFKYMLAP
ncbi:hypothetical protein HYU92_05940 [Candidatus Curtissbacteria bacterium]|nr:hypothetical protein [Candidatus Curtissbacteria bacterium]